MITRRCTDPCAEEGCPAPVARGSYCEKHAAVYYDKPRPIRMKASWWENAANATGDLGQGVPANECDAVRMHNWARSRRAAG